VDDLAGVDDSVLIIVIELGNCLFCPKTLKSYTPPVKRRVFPHCKKLDDMGVKISIDSNHVFHIAHEFMAALIFVCQRRCLTVYKVLIVLKWLKYFHLNLTSMQTIPQMAAQCKKTLIILCEKCCIIMGLIVTHFGDIAEPQNC
jgi:hypothetical protein